MYRLYPNPAIADSSNTNDAIDRDPVKYARIASPFCLGTNVKQYKPKQNHGTHSNRRKCFHINRAVRAKNSEAMPIRIQGGRKNTVVGGAVDPSMEPPLAFCCYRV